jgi:CP family cyanate transporter-like MFS transporter
VPTRSALGTAVTANGMLAAVMFAPALTIPLVLPLVGGSWRLALVVWAAPVAAIAILFFVFSPRARAQATPDPMLPRRWWPNWRDPLTWLLGFTFGCNNAAYYGANAFLPDFLTGQGRADLVGPALAALNIAQFAASFVVLAAAEQLQRAWSYLVFGPLTVAAFAGMVLGSGSVIVVSAAVMGFASAITFAVIMALPPRLSGPDEVHRTAAGMFTISYSCAVIIPTASGALWDVTGIPWLAFVPLGLCPAVLTVLGLMLSRHPGATGAIRPAGEAASSP